MYVLQFLLTLCSDASTINRLIFFFIIIIAIVLSQLLTIYEKQPTPNYTYVSKSYKFLHTSSLK